MQKLGGCKVALLQFIFCLYVNVVIPSGIQAHHDHCFHDDMPLSVGLGFHALKGVCGHACDIQRQFIPGAEACTPSQCSNAALADQAAHTLQSDCVSNCSSQTCKDAFVAVLVHHDVCEPGQTSAVVAQALHDFEELCEDHTCNLVTAPFNPNYCDERAEPAQQNEIDFFNRIESHGRLMLTDSVDNHIFVYDIDLDTWHNDPLPGIPAGASLPTHTSDGRYVVVLSRSGDSISFVSSGLRVVENVQDHSFMVIRGAPRLQDLQFMGTAPGHVEASFGWLVIFFDGTLYTPSDSPTYKETFAMGFRENLGLSFEELQPHRIYRDYAHHGNAWATSNCRFVVSRYETDQVLPFHFDAVTLNGTVLHSFPNACPLYHGFARAGQYSLAGCGSKAQNALAGHIMAIHYNPITDKHTLSKIVYPDTNSRSGTLRSVKGLDYVLAAYGNAVRGNDRILRVHANKGFIDPANDVLTFPSGAWPPSVSRRNSCFWGVQQGGSRHLVVALPDGYLYIYNSSGFQHTPRRVDIFPELRPTLTRTMYSCTQIMSTRVKVGARFAFVLRSSHDPSNILRVDIETGTVVNIPLPADVVGAVGDMAVVIPALADKSEPCPGESATSTGNNVEGPKLQTQSSATSGGSSNSGAVTALAVLLGIALVALFALGVVTYRNNQRLLSQIHRKLTFDNPNFESDAKFKPNENVTVC